MIDRADEDRLRCLFREVLREAFEQLEQKIESKTDPVLDAKGAAALADVHPETLREWRRKMGIANGQRVRMRPDEVFELMEKVGKHKGVT